MAFHLGQIAFKELLAVTMEKLQLTGGKQTDFGRVLMFYNGMTRVSLVPSLTYGWHSSNEASKVEFFVINWN